MYLDRDCVLVVLVCGEGLTLLGGDNSVTGNELGHDASDSLNTHGKGSHIQQQNLICLRKYKSISVRFVPNQLIKTCLQSWHTFNVIAETSDCTCTTPNRLQHLMILTHLMQQPTAAFLAMPKMYMQSKTQSVTKGLVSNQRLQQQLKSTVRV